MRTRFLTILSLFAVLTAALFACSERADNGDGGGYPLSLVGTWTQFSGPNRTGFVTYVLRIEEDGAFLSENYDAGVRDQTDDSQGTIRYESNLLSWTTTSIWSSSEDDWIPHPGQAAWVRTAFLTNNYFTTGAAETLYRQDSGSGIDGTWSCTNANFTNNILTSYSTIQYTIDGGSAQSIETIADISHNTNSSTNDYTTQFNGSELQLITTDGKHTNRFTLWGDVLHSADSSSIYYR